MTSPMLTDFAAARRLVTPTDWYIGLAGCGGTGSWLAPHVARLVKIAQEKQGRKIEVAFVDPDVVEEKNCYRQNFSFAEIGVSKAEALAFRLNAAWGLDVRGFRGTAKELGYRSNRIWIGCVDNAAARQEIAKLAEHSWWLDCGNSRDYGQVLLGRGSRSPGEKPLALQGLCTWLPSPCIQHPELLEGEPVTDETPAAAELSCADLALRDAQSLSINARVAAEAADFLFRFLLLGDLRRYAAYISLAGGSVSSKYVTDDNIRPYLT